MSKSIPFLLDKCSDILFDGLTFSDLIYYCPFEFCVVPNANLNQSKHILV